MMNSPIETVQFFKVEPEGGYAASSKVKVTYKAGTDLKDKNPDGAFTLWGSDGPEGGVLAWRSEHGDAAALTYVEEPVVIPVPSEISDRQFFQQLAIMGLITEKEAIAAVATGTLPAVLAAFVDALPTEQQFPARMLLQGATTFLRANPLVATFGEMQGMSETEIDDLWQAAAAL